MATGACVRLGCCVLPRLGCLSLGHVHRERGIGQVTDVSIPKVMTRETCRKEDWDGLTV